jgi:hypothetical protein
MYQDPIWLYDLHLLIEALSPGDAEAFARRARDRRVVRICADGIDQTHRMFNTRVPEPLAALVEDNLSRYEPTARFLDVRRQTGVLASDLRALPAWRPRLRLLAQHLFPPVEYMERRYGVRGRLRVAPFYAWRIARGVPRWLSVTSKPNP